MPKKLINSNGMVLITILLILLVINLLTTSLIKTSLTAKKTNALNQSKTKAFTLAINKLQILELNLATKLCDNDPEQATTNIKIIDSNVCGIDFYKITLNGKYDNTVSKIQSIWAQPNNYYPTCKIKTKIRPGRQSFLIIK